MSTAPRCMQFSGHLDSAAQSSHRRMHRNDSITGEEAAHMTADVCGSQRPVKPLVNARHVAQQQQALLLRLGWDTSASHPGV